MIRSAALPIDPTAVQPSIGLLRAAALLLVLVGLLRLTATLPGAWQRNDFAHYYLSARAALDGMDPYTTSLAPYCHELGFEYDPRITAGTNPPLLMGLVSLVAWMPPGPAYAAWTFLQSASLAGMLWLLMRHSCTAGLPWRSLALAAVLNSTALWSHYHYSQVQLFVALLIAAAYFAKQAGRGRAAVALVALAAGLKIYPIVLLPWFVFSAGGGRREAASRALIAAAVGLVILLVSGIDSWCSFASHALGTIGNSVSFSTSNYSLQSASAMLAGSVLGRPLPAEVLASAGAVGKLLGGCLIAASYLAIWRLRAPDWRAIGLLTAAMILASPVCWSHYLVLMILPVWLVWGELSTRLPDRNLLAPALLGGLCLFSEMDAPIAMGVMGPGRTLLHLYPTAALLLFALVQIRSQAAIGPQRVEA